MNPRFYGLPADGELLSSRLEKMVAKMIGVLAFRRHESSDPRSALYGSILGVDDLDFMTEQFTPRPYSAEKRAWLAAADPACNKARAYTAALGATPVQRQARSSLWLAERSSLRTDCSPRSAR